MSDAILLSTADAARAVQTCWELWHPQFVGASGIRLEVFGGPALEAHSLIAAAGQTIAEIQRQCSTPITLSLAHSGRIPRGWAVMAPQWGVDLQATSECSPAEQEGRVVLARGDAIDPLEQRLSHGWQGSAPGFVLIDAVEPAWAGAGRDADAFGLADSPLVVDLLAAALRQQQPGARSGPPTWWNDAALEFRAAEPLSLETEGHDGRTLVKAIEGWLAAQPRPASSAPVDPDREDQEPEAE